MLKEDPTKGEYSDNIFLIFVCDKEKIMGEKGCKEEESVECVREG